MPTEPRDHATRSGIPLDPVYDRPAPGEPLPGMFPFTRGPYASMYRGRLWTMRQFAGYGTPAETNERFRLLLERGQTGLSVAFDMPTLMGLDPDDPRSEGEVGRCGVAVATLDDTETLFAGIPLDEVSVSMTINGPAAWIFACYLVAAERQGVDIHRLGGTLQTDIFKEYTAQKEWLFPPRPHLRLDRRPAWRSAPPTCRGTTRSASPATTSARRARPPCRSWRSRWPTASPTWSSGSSAGWPSTRSRRGCRSSSTPTSICSRRSRSSGRRGASGPGGCATATARARRRRSACGSTRRRPACRSPRSSR